MAGKQPDISVLLRLAAAGEAAAESQLFEAVYDQLRAMARTMLSSERPGHTLQPTILVHEAFLRLRDSGVDYQNRQHFFAIAARAMHRILVDYARARLAKKRPSAGQRVELDDRMVIDDADPTTILAIDDALEHLARLDKRQAQIVEMRFFGGLTEEEIAEVLKVSSRTVKREWSFARVWLFARLKEQTTAGETGNSC